MTEKKLESFKIGDTRKPTVASTKKNKAAEQKAQSEASSLGFRRIETILEEDDAATVSESLSSLLQKLEDFSKQAKSNRDRAAAQKAIVAVERTADLLDYLFQTKSQMLQGE